MGYEMEPNIIVNTDGMPAEEPMVDTARNTWGI